MGEETGKKMMAYFKKHVKVEERPFQAVWLAEQLLEIRETDLKVARKGLPKSGPHPMVRNKKLLSLANAFLKFKLKDFAEHFGVNYGLVRLWNREQRVHEKTEEYTKSFVKAYVKEIKKLSTKLNPEKLSFETMRETEGKLSAFIYESKHYDFELWIKIYLLMQREIPADWGIITYNFVRTMNDFDIFNLPKDKQERERTTQSIDLESKVYKKQLNGLVAQLRGSIKSGKTKVALRLSEELEEGTINLIDIVSLLKKGIINNCKPKGEKKSVKRTGAKAQKEKSL